MSNIPLTIDNVLMAALWATVLFVIIGILSRIFMGLSRATIFSLRPDQLEPDQLEFIMERCYKLFPIPALNWDGVDYSRGNFLRIITNNNTIIEGKFLGINHDGMVCLMTNHAVVAHEIQAIEDIQSVE